MTRADLDRTFAALADPTRRGVVDRLRRGPRRASDLADDLGASRPAMSRHLRVLKKSGLITESGMEDDARARVYTLRRVPFSDLSRWVNDVTAFWEDELLAFKTHVERVHGRGK
jgi:DNA-binding transcriptional ArsR family regulator